MYGRITSSRVALQLSPRILTVFQCRPLKVVLRIDKPHGNFVCKHRKSKHALDL